MLLFVILSGAQRSRRIFPLVSTALPDEMRILTCGTCLDFYGLKEKLSVGGVTNMYDIVERMEAATTIVRP